MQYTNIAESLDRLIDAQGYTSAVEAESVRARVYATTLVTHQVVWRDGRFYVEKAEREPLVWEGEDAGQVPAASTADLHYVVKPTKVNGLWDLLVYDIEWVVLDRYTGYPSIALAKAEAQAQHRAGRTA